MRPKAAIINKEERFAGTEDKNARAHTVPETILLPNIIKYFFFMTAFQLCVDFFRSASVQLDPFRVGGESNRFSSRCESATELRRNGLMQTLLIDKLRH